MQLPLHTPFRPHDFVVDAVTQRGIWYRRHSLPAGGDDGFASVWYQAAGFYTGLSLT